MPRKKSSPEQIIAKLRQVEVLTAQGQSLAQASREAGISEQSCGLAFRSSEEFAALFLQVSSEGFSDLRSSTQFVHRFPPAKLRRHLSRGTFWTQLPARKESLPRASDRGFFIGIVEKIQRVRVAWGGLVACGSRKREHIDFITPKSYER